MRGISAENRGLREISVKNRGLTESKSETGIKRKLNENKRAGFLPGTRLGRGQPFCRYSAISVAFSAISVDFLPFSAISSADYMTFISAYTKNAVYMAFRLYKKRCLHGLPLIQNTAGKPP